MMSLRTPCPASWGPAPGPVTVTRPTGSTSNTTALVVPLTFTSGSSWPANSGCTRAVTLPDPPGPPKLSVATCLMRPPAEAASATSRPVTAGDAAAGDLLAPELPAEDQARQDHHLGDGVVALDVGGRVPFGQAGPLRLGQRVLIGPALGHPGEDEVHGGVEQAP